jgi:hypothetical protein
MSGVNLPYQYPYETVAVSQTAQVLGTNGAANDYLHRIVVTVSTALTSTVSIIDGSTTILSLPASVAVGVYVVELGLNAVTGPWKVTTGAGAAVLAIGLFSK